MLNENRFLGTFRGHNTRTIVHIDPNWDWRTGHDLMFVLNPYYKNTFFTNLVTCIFEVGYTDLKISVYRLGFESPI